VAAMSKVTYTRAFEAGGPKSRPLSDLRAELGITDDELARASE
jgi:hypothetical protein